MFQVEQLRNHAKSYKQLAALRNEMSQMQVVNSQLVESNKVLMTKQENLYIQLQEANEMLRQYRERQEQVEKVLKHELARTHAVLKKTSAAVLKTTTKTNKENDAPN